MDRRANADARPAPIRFLVELRRRRIFRLLIGYVVGGWVLIEVAETTFPYVGLPDRAVTLVIVLVVGALPVALVLGWFFDLTPGGLEITPPQGVDGVQDTGSTGSSLPPAMGSLPVPATAILGREEQLSEAQRLLEEERVRLLTLVGPGGSGKTRFALELAHRLEASFSSGAVWVSLGSVRDPALVPSSVGQPLGIGESSGQRLVDRIATGLADRELLLVLDNFEQVVEAADHVAEMLRSCPGLRVLVTSRAPLRLRGERQLTILPLPVPDPSRPTPEMMVSPAVRLFAERARDVNSSFQVTEKNISDIAAICRRLDGLPLALELVAARAKVLTPAALLSRLDEQVSGLERGARDQAPHQRTLRNTIAWSHELLAADERVLFRRLGVFAGGGDLHAIEEVAGASIGTDLVEALHALVDQSLVLPAPEIGDAPRFTMLEVIRQYASEALEASGDHDATRRRHAEHFIWLARRAEPEVVGPSQTEWLGRLEREHDNFRGALAWLRETDPAGGLELAVHLWRFWEIRGHLTEGRRHLDELLDARPSSADGKLRLKALYAAGVLADAQGDYGAARHSFEQYLAVNQAAGDRWGIANALNNMGVMALRHGEHDEAVRLYTRSVALWRELGNDAAVALALNNLGNAARLQGQYLEARSALEESLAMHQAAGDPNGCALTLGLLGEVARDEGAMSRARELFEESLALFRESGNRSQVARSLLELASIDRSEGWRDAAKRSLVQALTEYEEVGMPRGLADVFQQLASLAGEEGREKESSCFAEAARALRRQGQPFDPEEAAAEARRWAGTDRS